MKIAEQFTDHLFGRFTQIIARRLIVFNVCVEFRVEIRAAVKFADERRIIQNFERVAGQVRIARRVSQIRDERERVCHCDERRDNLRVRHIRVTAFILFDEKLHLFDQFFVESGKVGAQLFAIFRAFHRQRRFDTGGFKRREHDQHALIRLNAHAVLRHIELVLRERRIQRKN